ncbi:SCO7613 C-terminal domain-containing membrane protein, partial [Conyzicola sp.]|uniref:SCO7613 C-terminal domain-containing membrane protein n=1 Tax=Conyzicola sp. TaxID=1969404 RepID=UPI003989EAB6
AASPPPVSSPAALPAAASPAPDATSGAPVTDARPATATPAARRSSVQVALLIVGVSLVSIAAIYFLVYAFITYGLVWRSVIIGSITVAAFVVASLLRRKRLTSTAEGIGVFAVVLVYLDAFAVRANNLFGADSSDALVYWGATLVVSALGFTVWHRASALRVGSVAAATAFAPGVGLLVAGLAEPLDGTTRLFAAFLAVGLAGLVHPFVASRGTDQPTLAVAERAVAATIGAVGLSVAFFAGWEIARVGEPRVSYALWAVAAVAVAHAVVVVRSTDTTIVARVLTSIFSALGALAASLAVVLLAFRTLTTAGAMVGIAVAPTLIVLLLVFVLLRNTAPLVRSALRTAAYTAAAVAVAMLLIPATHLVVLGVRAVTTALESGAWSLDFGTPVADPAPETVASAGALVVVLVMLAAFARLTGTADRLRAPTVWAAVTLAALLVPLLGSLGGIVIGWLAVAAACVATLVWTERAATGRTAASAEVAPPVAGVVESTGPASTGPAPTGLASAGPAAAVRRLRLPLAVLGGVTVTLAYVLSWASLDIWVLGTVATLVLLVAARGAVAGALVVPRAVLLATAVAVALGGAAAAGNQFGADLFGTDQFGTDQFGDPARAVAALAIVLFGLSAVPLPGVLSALDRRAVFVLSASAIVLAAPFSGTNVVLALALVVAILGWLLPRTARGFLFERRTAAFALAPATAWLLASIPNELEPASVFVELAPIAAALLAAGGSLAIAARTGSTLRVAGDTGVALVAVSAVLAALLFGDHTWLVLLVAGVTALVGAITPEGLFAATGRRKHLGWVALALATLALWWRLNETSVTAVEPYVLPLSGALLVIAALDWRARRATESATAAPVLVLAALLVAVVPVALSTAGDAGGYDDSVVRAVLVGAVASALLLVGSVTRAPVWARPYLDASAIAGFAGVVIVAVARCLWASPADATADVWLAAALVVLVIAAYGQCSGRPGDRTFTPRAGRAVAIAGLTIVVGVEATLIDATTLGFARTLLAVTLFAAIHLIGQLTNRLPFDRVAGWVALASATVVAVVALASGSVDDVEWVSVSIAVSLLVAGGARLAREPGLRSSTALGGGMLVLFLPSLIESSDGSAVWRLVALGVLAVAAVVIGLLRRLQAPFVVGAIVAVVHGLTTFAPQILAVYESTEWWVWAGAGGIVVLVLSARYERSLRTAKNVVASIGNLR